MKRIILFLIAIVAFGASSDNFDISIQVKYIDFEILDLDMEPYFSWNPDTLSFDTTVYMASNEILLLENNSNVDVSVSVSANDRPDGYFGPSYTQWETASFESDTNSFLLRGWTDDSPSIDTLTADLFNFDETAETILPILSIDEIVYMLLSLTTPKATTDRFAHEIIVNYEISIF